MYFGIKVREVDGSEGEQPEENWSDTYGRAWSKVKSHHILIFFLIIAGLVCFHFRHRIAQMHDRYRTRNRTRYSSVGGNGFELDIENGLTSDTFDLHSNLENEDSRDGLLQAATESIKRTMQKYGVSFDEARLRYFQDELQDNGIGSDGVPTDSKTVTFGSR